MYPVSNAFLQSVQENTREYKWTGKLVTKSGIVYEIEPEDIVKGSGYITRSCCGSNEIELGSVYASEMKVTLFLDADRHTLEDAVIKFFYSLKLPDGKWETIPMGVFEISEANRHIKTIELTGYDYMLRFDKTASVDASSGMPFEFLSYACEKCNVQLAHTQEEVEAMPNGMELLGIYPDGNIETYRDLLFYLAQTLGRVCQINREGRLELIPYGDVPVVVMGAGHRFSSSYSDFVTRYTAVYSTNEVEAKSEYYCLDPDDGLTMNLGINPLLQYGLQNTRENIITNILNSVAAIDYVPFDLDTIGNPALDPMDVIRFTGGHADPDSISCITSITYKINGKQTLKGVGKNPLLSSAKSKTDKNIIGLLNQVETSKFVICSYENPVEIEIGEEPVRIINVTFASIESTSALFIGNINCEVTSEEETVREEYTVSHEVPTVESIISRAVALAKHSDGEEVLDGVDGAALDGIPEVAYEMVEDLVSVSVKEKKNPVVTFIYKIDDTWIEEYSPKQKVIDGNNIFALLYPMGGLGANSAKTLEVYMKAEGGLLRIAPANCKAAVAGSGIASGYVEWDGKIVVEEKVDIYAMEQAVMSVRKMDGTVDVRMMDETVYGFMDSLGLMRLDNTMSLFGLSDTAVIADTE